MNELIRDIVSPLFDKVLNKLTTIEENIAKLDKKLNNLEKQIKDIEETTTQHNNDCKKTNKTNKTEYYL